MTPHLTTAQAERFFAAGRRIADHDLVRFSSGNLSWRLDGETAAITATGAWLGALTAESVVLVDIRSGAPVGKGTPSVEAGFHRGILRERRDVDVVLHFQAPFATAVACGAVEELCFDIIPEIPYYIGEIAVVPYLPPGSVELAEAVVAALRSRDLAVLCNHGQVVVGRDFTDVIRKAGFFEFACQLLTCARGIRPLPPCAARELRDRRERRGD